MLEYAAKNVHDSVLSLIKNRKGKILDLGCGTGIFSKRLLDMGFDAWACDLKGIHIKGLHFNKIDLNKSLLPYKNDSFDIVVSMEVIEHIENPYSFIREVHRILKKGGTAIITTPNTQNWYSKMYFLFTSKILGFNYNGSVSSHITPINLSLFKSYIKPMFEIKRVFSNRGFIPLLKISFPIKNVLFGEILIIELKKR